MKKVKGDLILLAKQGKVQVLIHGCNAFNNMGAGIAAQIAAEFPEAVAADQATKRGDPGKLGTYSFADIVRGDVRFTVINAYTQFRYGRGGPHADESAIRNVFRAIKRDYPSASIAYPAIGAGYAGGDWGRISAIIDEELAGADHTFVEYVPAR